MEKAAYLDAMGITRWRQAGESAPLSPELIQAVSRMFDHPLFAALQCQMTELSIVLGSRTGEGTSVALGQLETPEGKRALWRALSDCGVL
ncbi:hypothetical protein [Shewanella litorisediminis]|uniref:Uncharacterized protein n=1 Tax=Shewanella litorisediminis TaxID=1173586 RepID=A0ABX7G0P8_9GAMM|nr:hypothetical protein [Shewanella litorisediminis]MCL2918060.1 hypothetical protein [Shewanella litorisediminis]QRH00879.1 hypothetical protein JQC75_13495 [Shewanella litorisediminis]